MPWNNQGGQSGGGGPWGQGGGKGGSPWGQGGGQPPQDIDALIRQFADAWRRMMPSGGGSSRPFILLLIVFAIVWGITGFIASTLSSRVLFCVLVSGCAQAHPDCIITSLTPSKRF